MNQAADMLITWLELIGNCVAARKLNNSSHGLYPGYVWVHYHFNDENKNPITNVEMRIWVLSNLFGRRLEPPILLCSGESNEITVPYPNELITPFGYYYEARAPNWLVYHSRANFQLNPTYGWRKASYPETHVYKTWKKLDLTDRQAAIIAPKILRQSLSYHFGSDSEATPIPYLLFDCNVLSPLRNNTFISNPLVFCYSTIPVNISFTVTQIDKHVSELSITREFHADEQQRVFFPVEVDEDGLYELTLKTSPVTKMIKNGVGATDQVTLFIRYHKADSTFEQVDASVYREQKI